MSFPILRVVIVGAGLTGLSAGVLLARAGHRVTVVDRDPEPPPASAERAWRDWQRPGVSQLRQAHLMLPRWREEMERELPELLDDLLDGGALRTNLLHLQPESVTGGRWPGDERFDAVTARRPVLEACLARLAATEPGLVVRRGVGVTGLEVAYGRRSPRIRGIRTTAGGIDADLVVDAAGRHTRLPRWVATLAGVSPPEHREDCGFVYYGRHFRARGGVLPAGRGAVLTHYPSLSLLTIPGDLGSYCLVAVTGSRDGELRSLRDESSWSALMASVPVAEPWLAAGEPITGVLPLAGLQDVRRSYVDQGRPLVTGLVAIGDAAVATNPSLGRGATIGLLDACALRDTLATTSATPRELVLAYDQTVATRVRPWVDLTTRFDRHRLGELEADRAGVAYRTDDPAWAMTTALLAGAERDPALARASARIGGMLATPADVLADPALAQRVSAHLGAPRYPAGAPTRDELVAAASCAPPVATARTSRC